MTLKVRLVCIDVDGTLVGSRGDVHPRVWPAAERARAAGVRIALSSGRPGFGVTRAFAERLDPDGWHMFQNGASVVHLGNGASHSAVIEAASLDTLVQRRRELGRLLELYTDDDYAFEGPPERARDHAALLGVPFRERPFSALAGPVVRAQWLVARGSGRAILAEAHPGLELSLSSSPAMPDTTFVNMTRSGVDKSSAVRIIAAEYGVSLDEVMFIGDADNDLAALRVAGVPVAMANADAQVRAAARHVVGHVDDGGVADALALALAAAGA